MFYKDYPDPALPGGFAGGINNVLGDGPNAITQDHVGLARSNVRFVLITGDKDFNFADCHNIHNAMETEHFQSLLIEQPGMGHQVGSNESLEKALQFILAPPDPSL
jgi:hypothetical protein